MPLTEDKLAKVAEVRQRLASRLGPEHDDNLLIRFCRARSWDVDAAASMVEAMLDWRRDYDVEAKVAEVENDPKFDFLKAYYPAALVGETKKGHPLVVERLGRLDPKGILSKYSLDEMVQFHVWWAEKLRKVCAEQSAKHNTRIEAAYIISDMVGLGWGHLYRPGLATLRAFMQIDQDYYPETLEHLAIVNPPSVFGVIWKIVKVWLDAYTLAKIEIITSGNLRETFQNDIDLDVLPEAFGGTSAVDLPPGGAVGDHAAADHSEAQTVTVSKVHEVQRKAEKGAMLLWDFSLAAHDIAFSLIGPDGKALIEPERRHDPWQGKMEAPMAGDYTFRWSNEFSMMRKKTLTFTAQVSDPDLEL